jgi:hypothetical protein
VHALALAAEDGQELDGLAVRAAEPVRHPGVELGRLPLRQDQVVLTEDQAEPAVQDVEPLVPLVGFGVGLVGRTGRDDVLERLESAGLPAQRQDGLPAAVLERAGVDPRVAGGRGADQFVQRHPVGPGQR